MKVFKKILMIILTVMLLPISLVLSAGLTWYTLPMLATTKLGILVSSYLSSTAIFWITLSSAIIFILFKVILWIFDRKSRARFKNFFIHLESWSLAIIPIALALYTFITANPLISEEVLFSTIKKVGIIVCVVLLLIYQLLARKISTIVNRKITAYETAKESNVVGRSSVIWVNFLKLFEIFFPEMILLGIVCFCVSWEIASYFIVCVVACLFPMMGNIEADFNIRREIRMKNKKEKEALVKAVAAEVNANSKKENSK